MRIVENNGIYGKKVSIIIIIFINCHENNVTMQDVISLYAILSILFKSSMHPFSKTSPTKTRQQTRTSKIIQNQWVFLIGWFSWLAKKHG